MKTLMRIFLLLIFVALILLLCKCSNEPDLTPAPLPMTMEEVRKHLTGTHEIKYEQGADYWHYIIYLPDGEIGIIQLSVARELCIVFSANYCDYSYLAR